jgi:hemerythrin-like domain-containing protein
VTNAIELLLDDHRKVKKLLDELDQTTERGVKTREELFTRIRSELTVHEIIEEEIFYPALKQHPKAEDIVHLLMGELTSLPYDDETWGAKFTVMKENVEHHVEEEEGDMFVKARQVFDRDELKELGQAMLERRKEAQQAEG